MTPAPRSNLCTCRTSTSWRGPHSSCAHCWPATSSWSLCSGRSQSASQLFCGRDPIVARTKHTLTHICAPAEREQVGGACAAAARAARRQPAAGHGAQGARSQPRKPTARFSRRRCNSQRRVWRSAGLAGIIRRPPVAVSPCLVRCCNSKRQYWSLTVSFANDPSPRRESGTCRPRLLAICGSVHCLAVFNCQCHTAACQRCSKLESVQTRPVRGVGESSAGAGRAMC